MGSQVILLSLTGHRPAATAGAGSFLISTKPSDFSKASTYESKDFTTTSYTHARLAWIFAKYSGS
jgi:hypothetical protein